jgi:hypothetical protein
MGIRQYKKDNLHALAAPLTPIHAQENPEDSKSDSDLLFWTRHGKHPVLVNLTLFRDGEVQRSSAGGSWSGSFTGRPMLIEQLAPALKALVEYASRQTVEKYLHALRVWWRILDTVDALGNKPVESVADISELHRQCALDEGIDRLPFSNFVRLANLARLSKNIPQLHWFAPNRKITKRYLPPEWQTRAIRFKLKHEWFRALARWERAEQLMNGSKPAGPQEENLLQNYTRFQAAQSMTGGQIPRAEELWEELPGWKFTYQGYSITEMLRGFYPDAYDVRVAFHLCLANTGWNPSVLVDLDVSDDFLEPHPKDSTRYLMRGFKARGKSEQVTEGLFKSRGSAGMVIRHLVERTQPLRNQLNRLHSDLTAAYEKLKSQGAPEPELNIAKTEIIKVKRHARSVWLYVSAQGGITSLDSSSYHRRLNREKVGSFVAELVEGMNESQPADRQISAIKATDFRDAFAAYAYTISGGLVLFVMKALGHKKIKSTQDYINNSLLNEQSNQLYRTFSNALWSEIKLHGRIDPTILAKWSRDGNVTDCERNRLEEYRSLKRSRIGVGCKNPTSPPPRIAPDFIPNGTALCPVQRCTLCVENAVIFPESLNGLGKRFVELEYIKRNISLSSFLESSFGEELENTRTALGCFDAAEVQRFVQHWESEVAHGRHLICDLEGK